MLRHTFLGLVFSLGLGHTLSHASLNPHIYLAQAEQQKLAQHPTWQRLTYAQYPEQPLRGKDFFLTAHGQMQPEAELKANILALLAEQQGDTAYRCRFPARSAWLAQQLQLTLEPIRCATFEHWYSEIQPKSMTLVYATDFMGNPSSMFGHNLLRIDPDPKSALNLVAYAVNYAATVQGEQSWSYAWKGLTGAYPGQYAVMPYYQKVKEYGDFESRDLWEYRLKLTPEQSQFMVQHLWEMQNVAFDYYFISDNCAYRLLGLIDLVRPDLALQQAFKHVAIPIETLKALEQQGLIEEAVYRPALETQLNAQRRTHGDALARIAQRFTQLSPQAMPAALAGYSDLEQAKILEMAYDALYLQLTRGQVSGAEAQPKLRHMLGLRSGLEVNRQRQAPEPPRFDPRYAHPVKTIGLGAGQVQGKAMTELTHRQAYHDLIDPQAGFRIGTQLQVLEATLQYREEQVKLSELNLLSVQAYSPVTPFKHDVSWGVQLLWQQEALNRDGKFSEQQQHGVLNVKTQVGYSGLSDNEQQLCYAQLQPQLQAGSALDLGWRVGIGPTLGCQSLWSDQLNSVLQLELPFWSDVEQWHFKAKAQAQYKLSQGHSVRAGYEYQQQRSQTLGQWKISWLHYFE